MKLKYLLIGFSFLSSVSFAGAPSGVVVAEEVAAIVGNSTILLSDIEKTSLRVREQRKAEGTMSAQSEQEEAFEMLLTQHLLTARAKMDSLDKSLGPVDDLVQTQVAKLVEQAGGVNALERSTGKPIYQIKADLTVEVQQMQLAQEMERKIREGVKVNYGEVVDFVGTIDVDSIDMIPAQYSYSQIVKIPPQTDERRYAIRERLLGFRKSILSGEKKLSSLALLYSMDRQSAVRRGEIGPLELRTFVAPFAEALRNLKPGEVSEIVETEYGYHLIELISTTKGDNPTAHFRHILLKPEFTVEESKRVATELDSLAKEVREGRLDFHDAAARFSDDIETKENGGRAFNKEMYARTGDIRSTSSRYMLEELQPMEYRNIKDLKVGEVSEPFETMDNKGNIVYKMVYVDDILPSHVANIVDDYDVLEGVALNNKQSRELDKWIDKAIDKIFIEIKPQYLHYNLLRSGWKRAALRSENRSNVPLKEVPFSSGVTQSALR